MEKIAQKVLENEIYNYFKTNIPELEKLIGEPVDEYEDFDYSEGGLGQDADFVEMYLLFEAIAYNGLQPVLKNAFKTKNTKRLAEIFKVIENFKTEYGEFDERYSQSLWSMFANDFFTICGDLDKNIFDYIWPYFSEDLKNEYTLWKTDYEKWQEKN